MVFSIVICVVVILWGIIQIYDDIQIEKDKIKRSVNSDYNELVMLCVRDHIVLNWVTTLESRIKKFIESNEYATTVPYDKFRLNIPHKEYTYINVFAFMVVDEKRNLKLTINFEPSKYDEGRTDKYLKHCVGINSDGSDNGLSNFIEKCSKTVMIHDLEKKKIETVEKLINK